MQLLIALGGNALLRRGNAPTTAEQLMNAAAAAMQLESVARQHRLVLTHGNGPQVGLLAMQAEAFDGAEPYPFDVMGAATAGMMGYMIEQALGNVLGYDVPVATIVTRVEVDPDDPEFSNPSKFVGQCLSESRAREMVARYGWTVKQDGEDWRRVVPSPKPQRIVWHRPIRWLLEKGAIVICGGGGGVPTCTQGTPPISRGMEAVIDKDRSSALLASELPADLFVIATDVEGVFVDYGQPGQRLLRETTPSELADYGFSRGSMGPKVEAACEFVLRTGNPAVIGALDQIDAIVSGESGTRVLPDHH